MTLKMQFGLMVLTTALAALAGCGISVDQRKADPGDLVGPRENAYYDPTGGGNLQSSQPNQIFFNNVVFLWPKPLTSQVTEAVIRASDQITINDDKGIEQKNKIQAVDKQLETAKAALETSLTASTLADPARDKVRAVASKQEELSNLTPMPEDQDYAKQLKTEIDALDAELGELPKDLAQNKSACKALFDTRTALNQELYYIGKFGEEQLAVIESKTDNFLKPDRVNIDKTGAGTDPSRVKVTMVDWPEKGTTVSTETGSIKVIALEPARFDRIVFLVNTKPGQEYYRFRLVRTRPEMETKDGRIFYQGEVFRYRGDISTHYEGRDPDRRGVAKFVNRN